MHNITQIYDTPPAINDRTRRSKLHMQVAFKKVVDCKKDAHKAERLGAYECKWCFYFRGDRIAGQAFTDYICAVCREEYSWSNTAVPTICPKCASHLQICKRCGADLDFKKRSERK